ncbi:MAG: ORF6N domain-containing protein [Flavobacteriales bacterium]|nr:ORF6N domain-containing protein [Flavobacteriales bacterium]
MGTLAVNILRKSPHTDLLPLEHLVVAEPPADYGIPVPTDEQLLGQLHVIRGQRVMLDRDLAELYGVEVRVLKQAVRRNMDRFPETFMFELTLEEDHALRSQIVTLKQGEHGKYPPFAFTEHGILMLANVLRSERAIAVSIRIIDLFVRMREVMLAHKDILLRLEQLERRVGEHGAGIQVLFDYLKQLLAPPSEPRKRIGFKPDEA